MIEVLTQLTVRLDHQERVLIPGQPVDLPDEKALKLLQKAPGQVRVSPYLGQIVVVEHLNGQRVLTLIAGIVQDDPRMPPGRWLGLAGPLSRWVRDSLIKDWQPRCHTCRGSRWWWSPEPNVFCEACHPPAPNWQQAFEQLADLTFGVLPDDPRLPNILAAVDGCDAAWLAKQWGMFQRHMVAAQWLMDYGNLPAKGGTDAKD